MASFGRRTDRAVKQLIEDGFRRFEPLQLVRLWLNGRAPDGPVPRVRFRADLDAGFPGAPISNIDWASSRVGDVGGYRQNELHDPSKLGHTLCITTPDLCIASALGPLPEPFLEWLRDLDRAGRSAMRDFLDIFNNRLHVMRYRVQAELNPALNTQAPESSALAGQVAALMGLAPFRGRAALGAAVGQAPGWAGAEASKHSLDPNATPGGGAERKSHVPLRSLLGMGGLHLGPRHSAVAVEQVLRAHLDCPVRLQPLVGAWRSIENADLHALGTGTCRLGQTSLLGRQVWDATARVRLCIGPLPFDAARRLLPPLRTRLNAPLVNDSSEASTALVALDTQHERDSEPDGHLYPALAELVHLTLDRRHDAEVAIDVLPSSVHRSHLTVCPQARYDGDHWPGLRLGQTSWLRTRVQSAEPTEADRQPRFKPHMRFLIAAFDSAGAGALS